MEQDRYQANHKLFITGMFSLVASISLVIFGLYILPSLLFGWVYDIPAVIFRLVEWLKYDFDFSETTASWLVLLLFLVPGALFGLIAYYASNKIDNTIFGVGQEFEESEQDLEKKSDRSWAGVAFTLKMIFIILIVLGLVSLFEWMLSTAP